MSPSRTDPAEVSQDGLSTSQLISPKYMAHFGIRTTPEKFDEMVKWHLNFLGGEVVIENDIHAMIAFDDEHHRLNILKSSSFKHIADKKTATGIYHISFHFETLAELAKSYEQKKARGMEPHWPVNHGMSTSMYYHDPDGNEFELQVDNFDTAEEARQFMATEEFAQNPIGVDIVMEEFLERVKGGEDEKSIKKRPLIGARPTRWDKSLYFTPDESPF